MQLFFKAGAAFLLAAFFHGALPPPGPRWRDVAEELRQAQPQARLQAQLGTGMRKLLFRPATDPMVRPGEG